MTHFSGLVHAGPAFSMGDDDKVDQFSPFLCNTDGVGYVQLADHQHTDLFQDLVPWCPGGKVDPPLVIPAAKEALRHDTQQGTLGKAVKDASIDLLVNGAQVDHWCVAPVRWDLFAGDYVGALVDDLLSSSIGIDVLEHCGSWGWMADDLGKGKRLGHIQIRARAGHHSHAIAHPVRGGCRIGHRATQL